MATISGHRRDIDGLRAIAVLSVVFFHESFRYIPGGFLGVDIFFVISGYLITSHIVRELEGGSFSLAMFYERRVRRIAPALFFMLLWVSWAAYLLLYPSELVGFEKSLAAAVLSVSNIYFWQTTNYFSHPSNLLLHTWSLGVEEQFYFVIPLLLMAIFRIRRRWLSPTLIVLTLVSLLLCVLTYRQYPDATFYLLPQRAFELLIGSLFGLDILRCPERRIWRELTSAAGLAMTLIFIVHLPLAWKFSGPGVLVPCIGAGLILGCGKKGSTLTGALLSMKPLSGIGLISYSVYLWHMPLIELSKQQTGIVYGAVLSRVAPFLTYEQVVTMERFFLITLASLACGYISWRFVEQPIRYGRFKPSRRVLFSCAGALAFVFLAASGAVIAARGLPGRYPAEVIAIVSAGPSNMEIQDHICISGQNPESEPAHCALPDTTRPNWLIIGDSHAWHLDYGLHSVFPEVNILQYTVHGCKPVLDLHYGESESCAADFKKLYDSYLPKHHFDLIIMSANWQPYDVPRISKIVDRLAGLHQPLMLVGPIMRYDAPLRLLLADQILLHDPSRAERHRELGSDQLDVEMAKKATQEWHVPYFSYSVFCPNGHCRVWSSKGVPLQWDETHLVQGGSVVVAQAMRQEGVLKVIDPHGGWSTTGQQKCGKTYVGKCQTATAKAVKPEVLGLQ